MLHTFNGKSKKWIIVSIIGVILLSGMVWVGSLLGNKNFHEGIRIENVDVSGLSVAKARELVDQNINEKHAGQKIQLAYGETTWPVGFNDILMSFNTGDTLQYAYSVSRTGNIFARFFKIIDIKLNPVNLQAELSYDRDRLEKILRGIKSQVDIKAEDASIDFQNNNITIKKEVIGKNLDIDRSMDLIDNKLGRRNYSNIQLQVLENLPRITYESIKEINGVLAVCSTVFNPKDTSRTANIKLACSKINNRILLPMEEFSMNEALGPRTLENGYKNAPVIFQNELVQGPGGGVCQVTTTLYGAVLRSEITVIERTHHSMPLSYVPFGQDATIAEGLLDFKFKNTRDYPVALHAEIVGNKIIIRVLGKKDDQGYTVKLKSVVLQEYTPDEEEIIYDKTVPLGEKIVEREAKKGLRVAVYKERYDINGKLTDSQKITEDVYRAVKAQVRVNPDYKNVGQVESYLNFDENGGLQ